MNVFGIGLPEIAVITALGLLVFGPKKLPELGRTLGKTLKGFQTASSEFEKELKDALTENDSIDKNQELDPHQLNMSEAINSDKNSKNTSEL